MDLVGPARAALRGVLVITAILAVVLLPGPAWAHTRLVGTTPAGTATVTDPIGEVTLTFNAPPRQRFGVVTVRAADGTSYSDGALRVVDATVHQPVRPLVSGSYTVAWRVVSGDDHPVQGEFAFTVALPASAPTAPAPTAPSGAATATPDPSIEAVAPLLPAQENGRWAFAILVGIAGAVFAGLFVRRRRHTATAASDSSGS
ncbi:MAG TPA: copper resistance CopC family protein [Micromonosporaceae bacterium]|nr:copper resistance CopC family protein [Micromonosporaceae bacterium]